MHSYLGKLNSGTENNGKDGLTMLIEHLPSLVPCISMNGWTLGMLNNICVEKRIQNVRAWIVSSISSPP
jgi:hypothetical protein